MTALPISLGSAQNRQKLVFFKQGVVFCEVLVCFRFLNVEGGGRGYNYCVNIMFFVNGVNT